LGLKQSDLAKQAHISASYLNLIEHDHRRIGGKLLIDIGKCLGVDPKTLTGRGDAAQRQNLGAIGAKYGISQQNYTDPALNLMAHCPDWADVIVAQDLQLRELEHTLSALRDRLGQDTALSDRAQAVTAHLDPDQTAPLPHTRPPIEMAEAFFHAAGYHFPQIEAKGQKAIAPIMQKADLPHRAARDLCHAWLTAYADDAARLPIAALCDAARATDYDPAKCLALCNGDIGLLLRRFAALPGDDDTPDFGLTVFDAAGAMVFRKPLAGFELPRFGAACPVLPVFGVAGRPNQPQITDIQTPQGACFRTWSVCTAISPPDFTTLPVWRSVMLLRAIAPATAQNPVLTGPECDSCPRITCPARR
jgi:predicted transcriptional regulator